MEKNFKNWLSEKGGGFIAIRLIILSICVPTITISAVQGIWIMSVISAVALILLTFKTFQDYKDYLTDTPR